MDKVLVAYFSATGTTKKVAEKLAKATGGNLFEIKPQVEYTSEDLNWNDKKSRSSVEMNDEFSRPEIENVVENIDDYDTVLVGFPVWWYIPSRIIQTFIEKHNMSGKRIITFAISGGSGIKGSTDFLKKNYSDLNIIEGKRFGWNESLESIGAWAKKL
ncbi:flavodoxin [Leptotrichia trevisanii]|jgi:flavodoxin|uniref:flavodoxin n=1 Tax=Leptotrichia trevisanii TaxID=109328 RepID=UPI00118CEC05|nr:flavodoxin [Leptotrichia trevisanii]BBM56767.1 flavodoxin [Leptotrichia trevisanii]